MVVIIIGTIAVGVVVRVLVCCAGTVVASAVVVALEKRISLDSDLCLGEDWRT